MLASSPLALLSYLTTRSIPLSPLPFSSLISLLACLSFPSAFIPVPRRSTRTLPLPPLTAPTPVVLLLPALASSAYPVRATRASALARIVARFVIHPPSFIALLPPSSLCLFFVDLLRGITPDSFYSRCGTTPSSSPPYPPGFLVHTTISFPPSYCGIYTIPYVTSSIIPPALSTYACN